VRGRLFLKTLLGFWLTYLLVSQLTWVPFFLLHYRPSGNQLTARLGTAIIQCSQSIRTSGPGGCQANLAHLQQQLRDQVQTPPIGLNTPPEVLAFGAVGGLAFSTILAWYLIVPIQRLRSGFEKLAAGRLETRVGAATTRRRDEIADLARDFDLMAARLQELVAARERLMHDISHELRSPLSRLQLAIGLARQDHNRLPASLDRIESEALRLNDMVNELLTLARVESRVSSDEYFDFPGLVESVVRDAEFEAKANSVEIAASLPPARFDLPSVHGSSALIQRAVENVIRNAIKFSAPSQCVKVDLRFDPRDSVYRLEVSDDGPGAPSDALPHLFEPFFKAGDQRDGFGLGLSIARRTLAAHDGQISASNRPEGGLLVSIALPAGGM